MAELNQEIVSCRACVRAVCMSSEIGVKISGRSLSLFPFRRGRFSLFSWSIEKERKKESPSPRPPISYPASAGFIGMHVLCGEYGMPLFGLPLSSQIRLKQAKHLYVLVCSLV